MFEDSLVESQGRLSTLNQGWTAWVSVGVQGALAAALVVFPLLHPEAMPFRIDAPKIMLPALRRVPVVAKAEPVRAAAAHTLATPSAAAFVERILRAPGSIPRTLETKDAPPLSGPPAFGNAEGIGFADLTHAGSGAAAEVVVVPRPTSPPARVRISAGVSDGMLLSPIRPQYPAIAKAAHVEGSVVVEAIISRVGRVESLRLVSGPAMLQNAALEAIRAARYRPYRLNGEATEVQTTITVIFHMAG